MAGTYLRFPCQIFSAKRSSVRERITHLNDIEQLINAEILSHDQIATHDSVLATDAMHKFRGQHALRNHRLVVNGTLFASPTHEALSRLQIALGDLLVMDIRGGLV